MNSDDATWRDVAMVMWGKMSSLYKECGMCCPAMPERASEAYSMMAGQGLYSFWGIYFVPRAKMERVTRERDQLVDVLISVSRVRGRTYPSIPCPDCPPKCGCRMETLENGAVETVFMCPNAWRTFGVIEKSGADVRKG